MQMSVTYIRSLSTDFLNGLIPSQLITEIELLIFIDVLTINTNGDIVEIIFASDIPDETILNTVISNHVPINYNYTMPYVVNNVLTNNINGTEFKYFGNHRSEIIISTNNQCHFNSITTAIAANNTADNIFIVYPGTY